MRYMMLGLSMLTLSCGNDVPMRVNSSSTTAAGATSGKMSENVEANKTAITQHATAYVGS